MMHLITGASGSGKSAYAEECLTGWQEGRKESAQALYLYVAAMKPYGEETVQKIQRHRKLRAGKGFQTIEKYERLKELDLPQNQGILLECVSNLTANELYNADGTMKSEERAKREVLDGIRHLLNCTGHLVVVTNEVFSDVWDYSGQTEVYRKLLGSINRELAQMADRVTEVVCGIPLQVKNNEENLEQF